MSGRKTQLRELATSVWICAVVITGMPALVPAFLQAPVHAAEPLGYQSRPGPNASDDRRGSAVDLVTRIRAEFSSTLDFAPLVDELFVDDCGTRNARAGDYATFLSQLGVEQSLVSELDERELRRGLVAFLNFEHAQMRYMLSIQDLASEDEADRGMPAGVAAAMEASRYLQPLAAEPADRRATKVGDAERFNALVDELDEVCRLYREILTPFNANMRHRYDANQHILSRQTDNVVEAISSVDTGYPTFGVSAGTVVIEVCRDGLLWYDVVDERGRPKILTVAIGIE